MNCSIPILSHLYCIIIISCIFLKGALHVKQYLLEDGSINLTFGDEQPNVVENSNTLSEEGQFLRFNYVLDRPSGDDQLKVSFLL